MRRNAVNFAEARERRKQIGRRRRRAPRDCMKCRTLASPPRTATLRAMNTRIFGRTGRAVGEVGLGTWQLGAGWGDVPHEVALATLRAAWEAGTTLFDTADVYGMGRSETLIGKFLRETPGTRGKIYVATKLGRFSPPGWPENFSRAGVRQHTEASLRRLGVDTLD